MFREMRRSKQAISEEECIALLRDEPRGVMSVHGEDGYPYAFPMNQLYLDGKLYFHCASAGHKLDAIAADDRVSFCVMDKGYREPGKWPLHIKSVIVFGRLAIVEDREKVREIVRTLGLKHSPSPVDVEAELARSFDRVQLLELTIEHMSGKLVNES